MSNKNKLFKIATIQSPVATSMLLIWNMVDIWFRQNTEYYVDVVQITMTWEMWANSTDSENKRTTCMI